ncbi:MAG: EAL domain-containing protein, partial [Gammaproteobacteria bacterium]|nr:EAL domain-containing protein [Gammaproteobacteria bacterium]
SQQAETFIKSRNHLLAHDLSPKQRKILALQYKAAGIAVPIQRRVIELYDNGQLNAAKELMLNQAIPAQEEVLLALQAFLQYEDEETADLLNRANADYHNARLFLIISGTVAIIIGLFISFTTVRQTRRVANSLRDEKERAQTTLYSIGDAVITTDAKGHIDMINPVAEEILGNQLAQVKGQHYSEVLQLYHDSSVFETPLIDAMAQDEILFSSNAHILRRHDHKEFAVEYTAAPIRDASGKVIGGILTLRDVTEMNQLSEQLQYQASHDALTGLMNRTEFEKRLNLALHNAQTEQLSHVLCYLDLDQFKVVNDTCGHSAGDELLKQLAPLLKPLIRGNDVLARLGGDEFGVLLEGCNQAKGLEIADRMRQTIKDFRFNWNNNVFEIGVSIGLVCIDEQTGNLNELMSAADSACYVAKDQGRNQVHIYHHDDQALMERQGEMQWLPVINHAIEHDRFLLYYQPIQATGNGGSYRIHEFLIRLLDQDGNIVPPMAFIPAAERYNVASALDRWVVNHAIEFLANHSRSLAVDGNLFTINLSAQSLSDESFLQHVIHCLQKYQIQPDLICFEITETAAIANLTSAMTFITTLREMGCKFALDDFGSGLSSFSYLKNLHVDFLKIDGSFIRNIESDVLNQAFVRSIQQVADIMGIATVAEYVETEQCASFLTECGVGYLQGHGIGMPRPIEKLLNQNTENKVAS